MRKRHDYAELQDHLIGAVLSVEVSNMKKADLSQITPAKGASYPEPYNQPTRGRTTWPLTKMFGIEQFGVNRVELEPGSWSTQRHWHRKNDEVVIVLSGELVLVTDDGEETLRAGDCVAFKAGVPNAHHLQNRSDTVAVYFDIGGRDPYDVSTFPEMGLEARVRMELQFRPFKEK